MGKFTKISVGKAEEKRGDVAYSVAAIYLLSYPK